MPKFFESGFESIVLALLAEIGFVSLGLEAIFNALEE